MRYKAIPRNSEIDAEVALLQGLLALDAAGEVAEKSGNVQGLIDVSKVWMKVSEQIQSLAAQIDPDARPDEFVRNKSSEKISVGFQAPPPDEPEGITAEENEDGRIDPEGSAGSATESKGFSRIHSQHGRFRKSPL